jgi:excinuclease UvrABC ATPase subunit
VTVSLPVGALVGIAGVSGSGKSSLISATLIRLLEERFRAAAAVAGRDSDPDGGDADLEPAIPVASAVRLEGAEALGGYAEVSQAPIGRLASSNPATYIGIWDGVRELFARRPEAVGLGLSPGHFSFNSKGACGGCGGGGRRTVRIGGDFSFDATCDECHGKRYAARRCLSGIWGRPSQGSSRCASRKRCASSPRSRRSPTGCGCWSASAWGTSSWASPRRA